VSVGVAADRRELAARLALLAAPGVPPHRIIPLITRYGSAVTAMAALPRDAGAGDGPGAGRPALSEAVRERVRRALCSIEAERLRVLTFDDADYPAVLLTRLGDAAPSLLFVRGDVGLLDLPSIAIVGSRRATEYGLDVAAQVGDAVARAGACVVSGLALGIDAAAHSAALAAGGATAAVLGCGVDVYYPRRNTALQDRIASDGLLISELLPGEPPRSYQFPHRNRIIAALSRAVVVVEAGVQSGAIRTAVHAMEQGVDVFGVPGRIDEPGVQGILALYDDGVAPFTTIRMLLESTGVLTLGGTLPAGPRADAAAGGVLGALGTRPTHIDAIARAAGVGAGEALTALLQLELDGVVAQLPGGRFRRLHGAPMAGVPAGR
jgi:DNA processing protein